MHEWLKAIFQYDHIFINTNKLAQHKSFLLKSAIISSQDKVDSTVIAKSC